MKSILSFLFALLFAFSANAQKKVKPIQTVKIATPTVHCELSKKRIESYLNRYDGITFVSVNVKKKETTVKYAPDRINIEEVKTAIANTGFDAVEITAHPDTYKSIAPCCKKPAAAAKPGT